MLAAPPACQACIFVTCNDSASPRHRGCSGCCRETLDAAGLSIAFRLLQLFPLPGDRHLDMAGLSGEHSPPGKGSRPDKVALAGHHQLRSVVGNPSPWGTHPASGFISNGENWWPRDMHGHKVPLPTLARDISAICSAHTKAATSPTAPLLGQSPLHIPPQAGFASPSTAARGTQMGG